MTTDPGIEVIGTDDLRKSDRSSPTLTREAVFETDRVFLERFQLASGAVTDWRHHNERDAYGVVLAGQAHVEYGFDTVAVAAGEFLYLPASVVYRLVAADDELVALVAYVGPGEPEMPADGPAPDPPDQPPQRASTTDLVPTGWLKNLTRSMPFPDVPVQQVRGHASGCVASDWHHHGNNDVLGYVLGGEGYVEWGPGEGERALVRTGEFFRIPAEVVHRDVNPNNDEQDYVLWLTGSEPRVVRVDGLSECN